MQSAVDEFQEWVDQHLLEAQISDTISSPLYHYTSAGGLQGILQTERIWFTSHLHLNDPSELQFGMNAAADVLAELPLTSESALYRKMVMLLFTATNLESEMLFFVGSFSRDRDELGQWRAYADNGRGFALGLAPHHFAIESIKDQRPNELVFLSSVTYGEDKARDRQRAPIHKAFEIFENALHRQGANHLEFKEFLRTMALHLIVPLTWNCLTTKHEAYTQEKEVRLLCLNQKRQFEGIVRTRVRGSELVPYIEYPREIRAPGGISEIVIGPAAPKNAEDSLRDLFASCGMGEVFTPRSRIPYRAI